MMMMNRHYTKGFVKVVRLALIAVLHQGSASHGEPYPSGYLPAQYWGEDAKKSIAGHILTRQAYRKSFEGYPLTNVNLKVAIDDSVGHALNDDDQWLLQELEDYHDLASEQAQINGGHFTIYMRDLLFKNGDILPDVFKEYV